MNITGKTKLVGLLGNPIEHTKSPLMHNSAYELQGLDYVYVPLGVEPDKLPDALNAVRAFNFAGVNVTIPYKEAVIPYLDELTKEASLIGAVNTIKKDGDKLIGYNTDGTGFVRDFEERFAYPLKGKAMLLLGAGGAARAIAVAALVHGVKNLMLVDTDTEKAGALIKYLKKHFMATLKYALPESQEMYTFLQQDANVLVNATPVGMHPEIDQIPLQKPELVNATIKVYDIVYNPVKTKLVQILELQGNACATGLGMLAGQGAVAYEIFTGSYIEPSTMLAFIFHV